MVSSTSKSLRTAIAHLYQQFEKYQLHKNVDGCSCCVSEADNKLLRAVPLHELTPQHLQRYARKALTTWGDDQDFRYLLPRLLELLACDDLGVETEIVTGKLAYADWLNWPAEEQAAVNDFLKAWWMHFLDAAPQPNQSYAFVDEVLCSIGQAVDDLSWYLEVWLSPPTRSHAQHLALYICHNYPSLAKKRRLDNPFWSDREVQRCQVEVWLESDSVRAALRSAMSEYQDQQSDLLLQALDYLEWLEPTS